MLDDLNQFAAELASMHDKPVQRLTTLPTESMHESMHATQRWHVCTVEAHPAPDISHSRTAHQQRFLRVEGDLREAALWDVAAAQDATPLCKLARHLPATQTSHVAAGLDACSDDRMQQTGWGRNWPSLTEQRLSGSSPKATCQATGLARYGYLCIAPKLRLRRLHRVAQSVCAPDERLAAIAGSQQLPCAVPPYAGHLQHAN